MYSFFVFVFLEIIVALFIVAALWSSPSESFSGCFPPINLFSLIFTCVVNLLGIFLREAIDKQSIFGKFFPFIEQESGKYERMGKEDGKYSLELALFFDATSIVSWMLLFVYSRCNTIYFC